MMTSGFDGMETTSNVNAAKKRAPRFA